MGTRVEGLERFGFSAEELKIQVHSSLGAIRASGLEGLKFRAQHHRTAQ